ncbi:MAG: phosphoglucosamine mutase [Desulfitobacteriia bacterium]
MTRLFGTDGVRGKANEELTPELAYRLGKAGALVLGKDSEAKILVGKDTRVSGDMLEAALVAGICSAGVDVLKVGVLPTPGIAYLTRINKACAGVVISASHNPYQDNGIKFFAANGFKLPDELEDEIENTMAKLHDLSCTGKEVGRVLEIGNSLEDYCAFLKAKSTNLENLKVVLDCANGAASFIAPKILEELGAEVVALACEPDGININDHCGSTCPEFLARQVLKHKADVGLAFDGDADRVIAVDEKGQVVDGDFIMVICALALKEAGKLPNDAIVVTVMSNLGLHKALKKAGIRVYETQVGDRYVLEKMLETGTSLGGEQSGHLIFLEHSTTGDGLLSGLQLLSILKEKKAKLSTLAAQMTRFPQLLVNQRVGNKKEVMENESLQVAIEKVQNYLGDEGRVLVRPSGTEALIRVMLEGQKEDELQKLAEELLAVIRAVDERNN